jgi:hypothetical protein
VAAACAAKLLTRGAFERESKRGLLELAQRKLDGEAGIKMTRKQIADAVRVKAVMGALTASLLRLDGMLAKFANVPKV